MASRGGFGDALERTVAEGLVAQARALVLLRQQDAVSFVDGPGPDGRVADAQEALRASADYYLNQVVPSLAGVVTGAHGAANLVAAFAASGDVDVDVVREQLARYGDCARVVAADLSDVAERARAKIANLAALVAGNQDRDIERIRGEIAQARADAESGIADLVTSSRSVGAGVGTFLLDKVRFVVTTVTYFGETKDSTKDAGKQSAAAKPVDTAAKTGTAAAERKPTPFPVESIVVARAEDTGADDASQAATRVGAAVGTVTRANLRLAALYQELYRESAYIAVAAVVADQGESYATALRTAADSAAALAESWDHVDVQDDWASLTRRIERLRAALTGTRGVLADY